MKFNEYKGLNLPQISDEILSSWKKDKTFSESIRETLGLFAGTPAWNDLSFLAQYNWKENIQFRLGLDNIFDIHYRTFASGVSAPGRNIKIGVNMSF